MSQSVQDFVNRDLKRFSAYDTERSIPHLFDGLKTSQRKILRTALKQGDVLIKCNQLGTKAAEQNVYHHSEDSLIQAVIGMGRDYPGSNNMPYLHKAGQFGNILSHESSSPRYISAKLHENAKVLFKSEDADILKRQWEEGTEIEPEFYLPAIPMLLVNGGNGRGTGYATNVFCHSARDVARAVVEYETTGDIQTRLVPHWEGFTGEVTRAHNDQIIIKGVYEIVNSTTIRITELPIGTEQNKFKELLAKRIAEKTVKSYDNESTEYGWNFTINVPRELTKLSRERIEKMFGLVVRKTQTLSAWVPDGEKVPMQFDSPEHMVKVFCDHRRDFFESRRQSILLKLNSDMWWHRIRMAFIAYWNQHASELSKMNKADLFTAIRTGLTLEDGSVLDDDDISRLTSMPIHSLTLERISELVAKCESIAKDITACEADTVGEMWSRDIGELL